MKQSEINILVEKFKFGRISQEELSRLRQFLDSSPVDSDFHASLDSSFQNLVDNVESLPDFHTDAHTKVKFLKSIQTDQKKNNKKWKINTFYKVATAAAVLLFAGFLYWQHNTDTNNMPMEWNTVATKHGERKKVTLNDGTAIILNGNSVLEYPATALPDLRLVKLSGEAFFDVAKNTDMPFFILSKDFTTRVVGTSFNIDSDIENSIDVHTGKVNIYAVNEQNVWNQINTHELNAKNLLQELSDQSQHTETLEKGDKASLSVGRWALSSSKSRGWHENELVHLNEPLGKIAAKAYRFYGDSIAIDPALVQQKISITFRHKDIGQVAHTLSELAAGKLIKKEKNSVWKITTK